MIELTINGEPHRLDLAPDSPLLWALRDTLHLTGTKYGCGMVLCGACTVHVDGAPVRSCSTPISAVAGKRITTIEAMAADRIGRAVQAAWQKLDVPQCGYCQSGQVMSAVALLAANAAPNDADIDRAMAGNICRCATYVRIRAAIHDAARNLRGEARDEHADREFQSPPLPAGGQRADAGVRLAGRGGGTGGPGQGRRHARGGGGLRAQRLPADRYR